MAHRESLRPTPSSLVDDLRAGGATVLTDPDATVAYSRDQCAVAASGTPAAVVLARSRAEVVDVVKAAGRHRVAVVPRGAGTGLSGGANALEDSIVLDLSRMARILEIDPVARTARVEPGVLNADLDRAAREYGLRYLPDPGSREISSIGGNLATNAGGMCCAKYGVTGDHALSLTAVTGVGAVIRTGALTRKNVVGLDLTRLLIGSEGTLGIIVEAVVRLAPVPTGHATLAASFATASAAVAAVAEWTAISVPAAVEFMDRATIRAVNERARGGLDPAAGAIAIAQFDSPDAVQVADRCAVIAQASGAETFVTDDPIDGEAMMAARRAAFPALEATGTTLLDDVAVPVHRLPEILERIESIADRCQVTIGTFGHLADGNLHPTIVFDPAEPHSRQRAMQAFDAILDAALDLGGSVSGEHGVGTLKAALVERQVGATEVAVMRGIKSVFDPYGILNPGRAY